MKDIRWYHIQNEEEFLSEAFQDTAPLKAYFQAKEDAENLEQAPAVEFITSIVEQMCQLRFRAEEQFRESPHVAISKYGALPLNWTDVSEILTGDEDQPPLTAIARIAQIEAKTVQHILGGLRKVLLRKREKIHISTVQQLDSHCLRWLTRQPGRTAAQKGGGRQQILAVIREESYNTYENRILKAFLELCLIHCFTYVRQYGERYKSTERLTAVRRFHALCHAALHSPEMGKIARLTFLAPPNYVLRSDPYYSKIWHLYLDLLRQKKIVETVWKARHRLYQEYFFLRTCLALEQNCTTLYQSPIWIRALPQNGQFLSKTFFSRVCENGKGTIFDFSIKDQAFFKISGNQDAQLCSDQIKASFSLYFIPWNCEELLPILQGNHYRIIYNESSISLSKNHYSTLLFNPGTFDEALKKFIKELVS